MKNQPLLPFFPSLEDPQSKFKNQKSKMRICFARLRQMLPDSDFRLGASFVIRHSTFVLCLSLLCVGCTITSYRSPSGEKFTRSSLGANTSLHSLAFEATTNGLRRVELHGYQNDSAQALGTITEAAVRGALSAAKP